MKRILALLLLLVTLLLANILLVRVEVSATEITTLRGILEKPINVALNRVQELTGENPQSTVLNQEERWIRLGIGAYWWQTLCSAAATCPGNFANLSIVPNGGTNVVVQPSISATIGALYQLLPEETSGFGGYPSGVGVFLPTDTTRVMIQGTIATATSAIGPLTPPLTTGQSINYLIECNILTVDTTSQPVNIISPGGSVTPSTANRDRSDTINCQSKAGVAATTGTQTTPTVDSGYVSLGRVAVAYATSTITTGMISASSPLSGNVFLSPGTQQTGSINVSGAITSGTSVTAPSIISGLGFVSPVVTTAGAATVSTEHVMHGQVTAAVASGSTPCSAVVNVPLTGGGAFTSAATYSVIAAPDFTASTIPSGWSFAVAPYVQRISGSSFSLQTCGTANSTSTGSMVINWIAAGN
jgi:hypothetical protein